MCTITAVISYVFVSLILHILIETMGEKAWRGGCTWVVDGIVTHYCNFDILVSHHAVFSIFRYIFDVACVLHKIVWECFVGEFHSFTPSTSSKFSRQQWTRHDVDGAPCCRFGVGAPCCRRIGKAKPWQTSTALMMFWILQKAQKEGIYKLLTYF